MKLVEIPSRRLSPARTLGMLCAACLVAIPLTAATKPAASTTKPKTTNAASSTAKAKPHQAAVRSVWPSEDLSGTISMVNTQQ